ncbi:sensor histidine kinase [Arcanobacterium haemolyticum]|nr:sensor histidine kinase [Arcanobacterium haemolyticum]
MTTVAVAVAVLLLGLPGIILGGTLIWRNAEANLDRRAANVAAIVEQRLKTDREISPQELKIYAVERGETPAHITVVIPYEKIEAGVELHGSTLSRSTTAGETATVIISISRSTIERNIALFAAAGIVAISFSFAVGVMIALRQSRRLSAPLIYLAAAAEQLGAGQTRPQMEESGVEEIDLVYEELVRTADRMAGRISAERQFAADASHQLRTPLAALSMRLEEIQYLSDDPDVQEEAGKCLEQVERLTGVVQDLLANSRSAAGGSTEAVRLKPIFDQQDDEWRKSFARVGRELVFQEEAGLAALANPASLSQIIATLIENSLKYGAGTTTVLSRKVGRGVVVEVRDEGEGVAEDLTEAIFRKGVSTGGSTGIGLPLAKSLAEKDGGRLELTQAQPPVFSLTLSALPQSLDPGKILPSGSIITMGSRRRRR